MKRSYTISMLFGIILLTSSCEMTMQKFSPINAFQYISYPQKGEHLAYPKGSTESPLGYYIFIPNEYNASNSDNYPLLVFLHGSGESGDSSNDVEELKRVLMHGPPKIIEEDSWVAPEPIIVASPQTNQYWDGDQIQKFLIYLINTYNVDMNRIYLTGLSMGGFGTISYLTDFGNNGYVSAAVAICGGGNSELVSNCSEVPIWAFHGDADESVSVSNSINFISEYNKQIPPPIERAKLTIYPGVGHVCWTMTYDNSGT